MKKENILVGLLAILAIGVLVFDSLNVGKKEEKNEINIVTDYSTFYTVNTCISRTLDYVFSGDTNSLLLVTNNEYKNENSISDNNILDFYPKIDYIVSFSSISMYYENINDNYTKYYVYGKTIDNFNSKDMSEAYFIVYLDKENDLFSIQPYDGKIFKGGVENE